MIKEGSKSPWGEIQDVTPMMEGVVFVSTAGHGGIHLERGLNACVHFAFRHAGGWYEEDCAWCLPFIFVIKEALGKDKYEEAKKTFRDWYPEGYEKVFNVTLKDGESYIKDERNFYENHKNDMVVVSASGDWKEGVPKGWVEVLAVRGGRNMQGQYHSQEQAIYYIPKEIYDQRGRFGFIVDEKEYKRILQPIT